MNSNLSQCIKALTDAGACAFGFAQAEPVDAEYVSAYRRWIADGRNGTMNYLANHDPLRFDPRELLPDAKTVIVAAFPYAPPQGYSHPCVADYALGLDYHHVLRERLASVVDLLAKRGAESRVCVDSAPLPERWWAVKAGVGFRGISGQLIVPEVGSGVFLAEIITTAELEPSEPCTLSCRKCMKCVSACPGGAIGADGSFDARRCISYLTTEHRGDLPVGTDLHGRIAGCDICRIVCPHQSQNAPDPLPEFLPDPRWLTLDRTALSALTSGDWRRLSRHSALRRIPFPQLLRNLSCN